MAVGLWKGTWRMIAGWHREGGWVLRHGELPKEMRGAHIGNHTQQGCLGTGLWASGERKGGYFGTKRRVMLSQLVALKRKENNGIWKYQGSWDCY